jgi:hypothetical protein
VSAIDPLSLSQTISSVFCAPLLEWLDIVANELEDKVDRGTSAQRDQGRMV